MLAEIDGIRYSLIEESDRESVSHLLASDFFEQDPVLGTVDMNAPEGTLECSRALFDVCLSDDISVKAVDPTDGRVVGVRLSYVLRRGEPDPVEEMLSREVRDGRPRRIPQKVVDSLGILSFADGLMPSVFQRWNVNEYVAFLLVNVAKDYNGRRIAQHLLHLCYERHEKKGLRVVKVYVTNSKTKHIFAKQGFQVVLAFPVKEYLVDGERFFKDVPDEKEVYGMVKQF